MGGFAVRWAAGGTAPTLLPGLDPTRGGVGNAINSSGTIAGYSYPVVNDPYADAGIHATYWETDNLPIDLNSLIDPSSGWDLSEAVGISDTGWVTGWGLYYPNGFGGTSYARDFLINISSVPEPSSLRSPPLVQLAESCSR